MIERFSRDLKQLLFQFDKTRPFVCDGNPLDCQIFIVGINPATEMKNGFLNFWSDNNGFDKKSWLDQYITERLNQPSKSGRKRRAYSNTRTRIEWLCSALDPDKVLETNIYSKPTQTVDELLAEDRNIKLFNFLVTTIKPKILFLHGKDTRKAIENMLPVNLDENKFVECQFSDAPIKVTAMKHLSRGWSKEKVKNFAHRLRTELHK